MLYNLLHKYCIYPLWSLKDGNYSFKYLRQFEKSQYLPTAELDDLRLKKAQKLVRYAYENIEFYKRHWSEAGFSPDDFVSWADFERLPTLTKAHIQQYKEQMVSPLFGREELIANQTGGSTGEPISFYMDAKRKLSRTASTIRHDRWAKKDYTTPIACIWGHPAEASSRLKSSWAVFKDRYISRTEFLDTSSITTEKLAGFVERLLQTAPTVYVAYANSVYMLARYIRDHHEGEYHKPKSIITSAELLTEEMREVIESVFKCKVFNRYGCRETSVIASECDEHSGMHVNAECIYLELLANGKPVEDGELGEVVVTDLENYSMPLIRYEIKDVAKKLSGDCACGRTLPRIEMAGGRTTDFITTPEKKLISGASLTIFLVANAVGIKQAQLIQDDVNSLDIKVVKGEQYSSDTEEFLLSTAARFVGSAMNIRVLPQDESIAVTKSGKHRFSISKVDPFSF